MFNLQKFMCFIYIYKKKKKNTLKKIRIFILKTSNVRTKYTCMFDKINQLA